MMEKLNSSTYSKSKTSQISFEIGDSKKKDFYPQFKTMHWDNECNFSLRLDTPIKGGLVQQKDEVIEWTKDEKTARFYEKETDDEFGALEFEIEYASKPASNAVQYTIESKGLSFEYQGELSEFAKKMGFERPDHVLGSYAFYTVNRRENNVFKSKAFHIYRPEVIDANGNREWCDMIIEGNVMTITMPSKFMDQASYPVILDPTIGYTAIGASNNPSVSADTAIWMRINAPASGAISKNTVYTRANTGTVNMGTSVYSEGPTKPATKLAEDTGNVSCSTTPAWRDSIISQSIVNATQYWIGYWCSGTYYLYYDSVAGENLYLKAGLSFETWPANPTDTLFADFAMSMYATYTAAGAVTDKKLTLLSVG